ncbi:hypothetical protein [Cellulomonas sp. P5_C5]
MSTTATATAENDETTTAVPTPANVPAHPPADHTGDAERDDPDRRANAQAARYRRQLRTVEEERDELAARLQGMQRAEVERVAADLLAQPAALWATGVDVAEFIDEDGHVDADKVTAAARVAVEALGLAHPPRTPLPDRSQGQGPNAPIGSAWVAAMDPRRA